jgi:hypothetical protein
MELQKQTKAKDFVVNEKIDNAEANEYVEMRRK